MLNHLFLYKLLLLLYFVDHHHLLLQKFHYVGTAAKFDLLKVDEVLLYEFFVAFSAMWMVC